MRRAAGASVAVGTAGLSTSGLLGVVFVTLKLTGYIDWSWLWVTAPFWLPTVLTISVFLIIGLSMLFFGLVIPFIIALFDKSRRSKR